MRHLKNYCLLPLNPKQMVRFGLPDSYKYVPRLNYIAVVCCSLLNAYHPGFYPLAMDVVQQGRFANIIQRRIFLENTLLHPELWPISFTAARTANSDWRELSFGDLAENDFLGFPQLDRDSINPIAIELVSGPHALKKGESVFIQVSNHSCHLSLGSASFWI